MTLSGISEQDNLLPLSVWKLTVISLSCSSSWDFSVRTFSAAFCSGFSASSSDLWPFFCWVAVHNNRGDALGRMDTHNRSVSMSVAAHTLAELNDDLGLDKLTGI